MEEAVRRGDLNAVTEYIRFGSADSKWKREISLLLVAIEKGYEDIALALLGAQTLRWEDWVAHGVASDYGIEVLVQKLSVQFLPSVRAGANCVGLTQMQMSAICIFHLSCNYCSHGHTCMQSICRYYYCMCMCNYCMLMIHQTSLLQTL